MSSSSTSERVLNKDTWPAEAKATINDIKAHVKEAFISVNLQSTNQIIYINLTTLEKKPYTVEMSTAGFRIVGKNHDDTSMHSNEVYYETPYALLNDISPQYRQSFGGELMHRLSDLAKQGN